MPFFKTASANGLFCVAILSLVTSCTFTTTRTKNPVFARNLDTLSYELKSLTGCENINLQGKEKKTGNQAVSELTVRLINGKNVPADQAKRDDLGKEVARLLKQSLKNPDDFDNYAILFVNQTINGPVTKSNYTGRTYKKEEL